MNINTNVYKNAFINPFHNENVLLGDYYLFEKFNEPPLAEIQERKNSVFFIGKALNPFWWWKLRFRIRDIELFSYNIKIKKT